MVQKLNVRDAALVILSLIVIGSVLFRFFQPDPEVNEELQKKLIIAEYEKEKREQEVIELKRFNDSLRKVNEQAFKDWEQSEQSYKEYIKNLKNQYDEARILNRNSTTDQRILSLSEWLDNYKAREVPQKDSTGRGDPGSIH